VQTRQLVDRDADDLTDFRGKAPSVCLARPGGPGRNEGRPKGQRPDHLHNGLYANDRGFAPEYEEFHFKIHNNNLVLDYECLR
jgi:hypothetical protein